MDWTQPVNCQNCLTLSRKLELFELLKQKCCNTDEIARNLLLLKKSCEKSAKLLENKNKKLSEVKCQLKEAEKADDLLKRKIVEHQLKLAAVDTQYQDNLKELESTHGKYLSLQEEKQQLQDILENKSNEIASLTLILEQSEEKYGIEISDLKSKLKKSLESLKRNKKEIQTKTSLHSALNKKHETLIDTLLQAFKEDNFVQGEPLEKLKKQIRRLKAKDDVAKLEAGLNTPSMTPDGTASSDTGIYSGDEDFAAPSLTDDLLLSSDSSDDDFEDIQQSISPKEIITKVHQSGSDNGDSTPCSVNESIVDRKNNYLDKPNLSLVSSKESSTNYSEDSTKISSHRQPVLITEEVASCSDENLHPLEFQQDSNDLQNNGCSNAKLLSLESCAALCPLELSDKGAGHEDLQLEANVIPEVWFGKSQRNRTSPECSSSTNLSTEPTQENSGANITNSDSAKPGEDGDCIATLEPHSSADVLPGLNFATDQLTLKCNAQHAEGSSKVVEKSHSCISVAPHHVDASMADAGTKERPFCLRSSDLIEDIVPSVATCLNRSCDDTHGQQSISFLAGSTCSTSTENQKNSPLATDSVEPSSKSVNEASMFCKDNPADMAPEFELPELDLEFMLREWDPPDPVMPFSEESCSSAGTQLDVERSSAKDFLVPPTSSADNDFLLSEGNLCDMEIQDLSRAPFSPIICKVSAGTNTVIPQVVNTACSPIPGSHALLGPEASSPIKICRKDACTSPKPISHDKYVDPRKVIFRDVGVSPITELTRSIGVNPIKRSKRDAASSPLKVDFKDCAVSPMKVEKVDAETNPMQTEEKTGMKESFSQSSCLTEENRWQADQNLSTHVWNQEAKKLQEAVELLGINSGDLAGVVVDKTMVGELRCAMEMALRKACDRYGSTMSSSSSKKLERKGFCRFDPCDFEDLCNQQHYNLHLLARSKDLETIMCSLGSPKRPFVRRLNERKTKLREKCSPKKCETIWVAGTVPGVECDNYTSSDNHCKPRNQMEKEPKESRTVTGCQESPLQHRSVENANDELEAQTSIHGDVEDSSEVEQNNVRSPFNARKICGPRKKMTANFPMPEIITPEHVINPASNCESDCIMSDISSENHKNEICKTTLPKNLLNDPSRKNSEVKQMNAAGLCDTGKTASPSKKSMASSLTPDLTQDHVVNTSSDSEPACTTPDIRSRKHVNETCETSSPKNLFSIPCAEVAGNFNNSQSELSDVVDNGRTCKASEKDKQIVEDIRPANVSRKRVSVCESTDALAVPVRRSPRIKKICVARERDLSCKGSNQRCLIKFVKGEGVSITEESDKEASKIQAEISDTKDTDSGSGGYNSKSSEDVSSLPLRKQPDDKDSVLPVNKETSLLSIHTSNNLTESQSKSNIMKRNAPDTDRKNSKRFKKLVLDEDDLLDGKCKSSDNDATASCKISIPNPEESNLNCITSTKVCNSNQVQVEEKIVLSQTSRARTPSHKPSKLQKLRTRVSRIHPLSGPNRLYDNSEDVSANALSTRLGSEPCEKLQNSNHSNIEKPDIANVLEKFQGRECLRMAAASSGRTAQLIEVSKGALSKRRDAAMILSSANSSSSKQSNQSRSRSKLQPLVRPQDRINVLNSSASVHIEPITQKNVTTGEGNVNVSTSSPIVHLEPAPRQKYLSAAIKEVQVQEKVSETSLVVSSKPCEPLSLSHVKDGHNSFLINHKVDSKTTTLTPLACVITDQQNCETPRCNKTDLQHTENIVANVLKAYVAATSFTPAVLQKAIDALSLPLYNVSAVIVRDVVYMMNDDFDTPLPLQGRVSPTVPQLTPVQQQLVTLVLQLSFQTQHFQLLPHQVLELLEYRVFRLGKAPEGNRLFWCSRLYAALCRALGLRSRALIFCWDALYALRGRSYGIVKTVLDVWPHLFPLKPSFETACPNAQVMLHFLRSHVEKPEGEGQSRKFDSSWLKRVLNSSGMQTVSCNSSLLASKIFSQLVGDGDEKNVSALILLAKREEEKWTMNHLVNGKLLPALEQWRNNSLDDFVGERVVFTICSILRALPPERNGNSALALIKLLRGELLRKDNSSSISPIMQEVVAIALTLLSRHDIENVAFALLSWSPGHGSTLGYSSRLRHYISSMVKTGTRPLSWWQNRLVNHIHPKSSLEE